MYKRGARKGYKLGQNAQFEDIEYSTYIQYEFFKVKSLTLSYWRGILQCARQIYRKESA